MIKVIIYIISLLGAYIHLAILIKMLVILAFPLSHASSGRSLRRGFRGIYKYDLYIRSGFIALSYRNYSSSTLFLIGSSRIHYYLLL